jgi:hypothetical protein
MTTQAGVYRTHDAIALLVIVEKLQVALGQPIQIGVGLENRSRKTIYVDMMTPYGRVEDPYMPFKIEVWFGNQRLPYRGPVIKRIPPTDESLVRVDSGGSFAGLFFDLTELNYQLAQGSYQVVLWYDSTGMRGTWTKAKRLWRGRTSKVRVPIEVI